MTSQLFRDSGSPIVRRFLPFLVFLMLTLVGFSGMAHAADLSGGKVAGIELTVHADGDRDQTPPDGDQSFPHHHSYCHGHDLGTTARTAPGHSFSLAAPAPAMSAVAFLKGHDGLLHLRPPQA